MSLASWSKTAVIPVAVTAVFGFLGIATSDTFVSTNAPGQVRPDVPVTAVDLRQSEARNSPVLVADPTDAHFVALAYRIDAPAFSCGLAVSFDGGRGWTPANAVPSLPKGAERCYAPEVAFDRTGRFYYLFVGLHTAGNIPMGVFLTTSTDRGRHFSQPHKVLGPNSFGVRMAVDTTTGPIGRIHLVWLQANAIPPLGGLPTPPNPILSAFSDDSGRRFSRPVMVSDAARKYVVAPALVLGPRHQVHVAYYDMGADRIDYQGLEGPTWEGLWSLMLATSTDGGKTFGSSHLIDDSIVPPERVMLILTMPPAALVADKTGAVYVAWTDARNGDWDVLLRRSGDGGQTWDGPIRMNDDTVGNGRHQYLPHLGVSPSGRLDAVFYDRRDDSANVHNHISFTSSVDGGKTFEPNVRLSTEVSDTFVGARYFGPAARGKVEFGSRLALLSTDTAAVAAWTDTRNTFDEGDELAGPTPQDIYATEVDFAH